MIVLWLILLSIKLKSEITGFFIFIALRVFWLLIERTIRNAIKDDMKIFV